LPVCRQPKLQNSERTWTSQELVGLFDIVPPHSWE
jgi:hypothetical protein